MPVSRMRWRWGLVSAAGSGLWSAMSSHGIRLVHFFIGDDDDDEPWKERESLPEENFQEVENEKSKVRRLGEERE